jgi:aspartokinase
VDFEFDTTEDYSKINKEFVFSILHTNAVEEFWNHGIWSRIKCCWNLLTKGTLCYDVVVLSEEDTKLLHKFISLKLEE